MSKKEKKDFDRRLLSRSVSISGIDGNFRLCNLFTKKLSAAVIIRKKNGMLVAIGYNG